MKTKLAALTAALALTGLGISTSAQADNQYGCDVAYFASSNAAAKNVVVCANKSQVIFAYGPIKSAQPDTLLAVNKTDVTLKQETTAKHAMTETKTTAIYIPQGNETYLIRSTTYMVNVMKIRTPTNRLANIDDIPPGDILENVIFDKDSEKAALPYLNGVVTVVSE